MKTGVDELIKAYRGEVSGEAFFVAMAQNAPEPHQQAKWRTLASLENLVADRIGSALKARGIEMPRTDADRQRGLREAGEYAALSWTGALEKMLPELERYVQEFESSEAAMPQDLLPLAQFVTAHERALVRFVALELAADGAHSLDAVRELLRPTGLG